MINFERREPVVSRFKFFSPFRERAWIFFAVVFLALIFSSCRSAPGKRENAVVHIFQQVSPAVVSIRAVPVPRAYRSPFYRFPVNPFFNDFFRDFGIGKDIEEEPDANLGSGVIIDSEGHILTNEHVVMNAAAVLVQLEDGTEYEAEVMGSDARSDLAVLRIEARSALPYLEMGHSDDLMIGETVIAIGNPFGLGHTLTTGVISSLHRTLRLDDRVYQDLIQADACINPGNSGGPLLNIKGELIGITTAIYQKAQGIGFAIPIERARRIVDDLIKYGEVQPGWLGFSVQELTPSLRVSLNYTGQAGVLISRIQEGSPAHSAGIEAGEILERLDGNPVSDLEGYIDLLREITVNDLITLNILSKSGKRQIKVKASAFPLSLADELIWNQLGIEISLSPCPRGVKISRVNPKSRAGQIGLVAGDIILKVNQYWIEGPEHFRQVMVKNRQMGSVLLGIQRGNVIYYTTLPLHFIG
jgi:serine protease Do